MEATTKRKIRSGDDVDHLFPKPIGNDRLIKMGATVEDTVEFIPGVVGETLDDTKTLAKELKGKTLYDTCKNIWHFVFGYIAYEKDEKGKEQIRRPARSWTDRKRGVDCDDYTVFISSILTNLEIPHDLRIAKYWWSEGRYSHIYPVVKAKNGEFITIDCVVDKFNYEEPFTEIKDKTMDLYYLNGIERPATIDADDMTQGGLTELGKVKLFQKVGSAVKKGLHAVNRVNPATALLRAGVLASMKLNVFRVAEKLRFAYLSDVDAQKRGINMSKFARLKQVREKIEKIYYGAGGKPENLKEAILTGKGNASKEVSGLMGNETQMPLRDVIGQRLFTSEIESLDGLGEPATAAALAAASAVMASLAAILKSIGDLKGKGTAEEDAAAQQEIQNMDVNTPSDNTLMPPTEMIADPAANTNLTKSGTVDPDMPTTNDPANRTTDAGDGTQPGWWDKNKSWAKPTAIGVGVLGLLYTGYKLTQSNKNKQKAKGGGLSGFHHPKKHGKRKRKKISPVRWK